MTMNMTKARRDGLNLMCLGCAIFLFMGLAIESTSRESMIDFKVPYYSARCLLQHCDPYNQREVLQVYRAERGERAGETLRDSLNATRFVYPPVLFLFTVPLAILKFGPAHLLWLTLLLASVILSSFLIWDLAAERAPVMSAILIAFMLANSELVALIGNPGGIAIGLCLIAVWCFLKKRHETAGVICLAVSLLIKPHDVVFVWLYFVLAGGAYRKRGLQTLAVAVALGLPTVLCVTHFSPHWFSELHATVSSASAHGGPDDPGPSSSGAHGLGMMINLQTALSYFRDNPHFYNPVTYLLCGVFLMVWVVVILRSRPSPVQASLALAAIAPFSMLPVYHRQSDVLLLILAVPACTILRSGAGLIGKIALLAISTAFVLTGDFTWAAYLDVLHILTRQIPTQLAIALQLLPIPLVLLGTASLYLWIYAQRALLPEERAVQEARNQQVAAQEAGGRIFESPL